MTVKQNIGTPPDPDDRRVSGKKTGQPDESQLEPVPGETVEAILRQLVALRITSVADDQLVQLVRIVDSASWSAPVPMTILVDGTVIRGVLVPSEVSAAFLDDALRRSAHDAVDRLEGELGEGAESTENPDAEGDYGSIRLEQARSFLKRIRQRPFSITQSRVRQRNANALIAISKWHQTRDPETRHGLLDIPGNYADPTSASRDVIPYTAGQRALTLADVKILAAGEWLAVSAPVRVAIGRIGAWTIDL